MPWLLAIDVIKIVRQSPTIETSKNLRRLLIDMRLEKLQFVLIMYEKIVAIMKAMEFARTGSGRIFSTNITTTKKCNDVLRSPIQPNRINLI
jgi:hypothetical protein